MINESRVKAATDYRDLLLEIIALEEKIFGGTPEPEEPKEKKTTGGIRRVKLDRGKCEALREAGWSLAKIAEEFGCSESTIYNAFKKWEGENGQN